MFLTVFLLLFSSIVNASAGKIVFGEQKQENAPLIRRISQQHRNNNFTLLNPFLPSACPDGEDFCEDSEDYPDRHLLNKLNRNVDSDLDVEMFLVKRIKLQPNHPAERPSGDFPASMHFRPDERQTTAPQQSDDDATSSGTDEDSDVIQEEKIVPQQFSPIASRSGFIEEEPVCKSHKSYIYPVKAKNTIDEWRFLWSEQDSDDTKEYLAQVKVERCTKVNKACDVNTGPGVETVCRQGYSERKLLAISPEGHKYVDMFSFPSSCSCFVKKTVQLELMSSISRRSGFGSGFSRGTPDSTDEKDNIEDDEEDSDGDRNP